MKSLNNLVLEAGQLIENAKKQGEAQREDIINQARAEAERVKESAKREIVQEKEKAVAALREQVASCISFDCI